MTCSMQAEGTDVTDELLPSEQHLRTTPSGNYLPRHIGIHITLYGALGVRFCPWNLRRGELRDGGIVKGGEGGWWVGCREWMGGRGRGDGGLDGRGDGWGGWGEFGMAGAWRCVGACLLLFSPCGAYEHSRVRMLFSNHDNLQLLQEHNHRDSGAISEHLIL